MTMSGKSEAGCLPSTNFFFPPIHYRTVFFHYYFCFGFWKYKKGPPFFSWATVQLLKKKEEEDGGDGSHFVFKESLLIGNKKMAGMRERGV